jgi:alkylhydroperoxidase family enzyme
LGSEELVAAVMRDIETAPITDAEKALLRFVEKVNQDSPSIGTPDIEALYAHGWTDEAVYDAVTVCAMFNFFNRWIDATGVHAMSDEAHRAAAPRMAPGYIRTPHPK